MCLRCLRCESLGKSWKYLGNYYGIATEIPRCSKWFLVITIWESYQFWKLLRKSRNYYGISMLYPNISPPQKKNNIYPNYGITILPMHGDFGDGLWHWVYHITTNVFQHISTISWWLVFKHICIYAGKAMINHPPNHHKLGVPVVPHKAVAEVSKIGNL